MSPVEQHGRETVTRCRLCGSEATPRFKVALTDGLEGSYDECAACGFLSSGHLDDPAVMALVYARATADDDPGAAFRQQCVAQRLAILARVGVFGATTDAKALDVGCGSGFLAAYLATSLGFRSFGYDPHSLPAFTPSRVLRDWERVKAAGPFRLVTAVEVVEHFADPIARMREIAAVMDPDRSFLYFTTELYDGQRHGPDWWYLAPHTAQHCSFYSRRSLEVIRETLGASALHCVGGANEWLLVRGAYSEARIRAAVAATRILRRLGLTTFFAN